MSKKYKERKGLNLPKIADEIMQKWKDGNIFEKSISLKNPKKSYVFFEGPPSANGLPGIHHVMGRTIKDIFCRYKTLKGYQVKRKAGWDTHGLPVELGVEKELKITKEDIGKKISIDQYNDACKKAVMRYTDIWNDLTLKMGYWVDMKKPYITYESKYMESVWYLLKELYKKNLIYKGHKIQPYSPAAGTGLSSHEINQPGCYKDITDTTIVAQFKIKPNQKSPFNNNHFSQNSYFLAWTTTPWTLPSNTALTVGEKIEYVLIKTYNQYTFKPIEVILAKKLINKQFGKKYQLIENQEQLNNYQKEDKKIPYQIIGKTLGKNLCDIKYEQLLPYALPYKNSEKAFRVISGDFVTTEDGTGIVHTAPTFGADDAKVAKNAGIPGMLVLDENNKPVPLVDFQGKFRPEMGEFSSMYVKNEYYKENPPEKSVDVQIAIKLKTQNLAFKVEKYVHSYPHCWRTDKPILYYPLDSWFIKVTECRNKMVALNKTINWKPESTGTGRFGNWLKNANDWNLSRSRYWGIPIPIWRTEDATEQICIGSIEELKRECEKSVQLGFMDSNPLEDFEPQNMSEENYNKIDLHKHYVDAITLVSPKGKAMKRESDLIDVWFDSGSMPYAQWHYPFENKKAVENGLKTADFIAEGVDQTRGWFYTLHAIASMIFGEVAYKNVVSNGLVLDKKGQKMSKRIGNGVDPFETLKKYGPDPTRWYMITNAQPWDNLKFDFEGIVEVQRKFFGTLFNTYNFFALYANIDGFDFSQEEIDLSKRPEIDRWIISKLNTLIKDVDKSYETFEPTRAGRLIQDFVLNQLSNWYVRLCRRRFWKGELSQDKISAYQTLYTCLETISLLSSPIAPFFSDQLFNDLNEVTQKKQSESVHLANFPISNKNKIDVDLEERMAIAQQISSMVLGLRKKEKIKVRQPLQKIMVPVLNEIFGKRIEAVKPLILSEVNVKELELLNDTSGILIKSIKPNFKTIGKKYGKQMKSIQKMVSQWKQSEIEIIEKNNGWKGMLEGINMELNLEDFEISTQDIPGWLVANEGKTTVALDVTVTEKLKQEGIAREIINRIQNYRKESGFEVTDKINIKIDTVEMMKQAIKTNEVYICNEVLANNIEFTQLNKENNFIAQLENNLEAIIKLEMN